MRSITLGSVPFCPQDPAFQNAKKSICGARDIKADRTRDNRGEPCDALSIGITFTATEAQFSDFRPRTVDPRPGCDAGPEAYRCP
jgi:hypothetical protein